MKTNYLFILAYLFLAGCSSYSDSIEEQEVGYIDYMTCPDELITAQDSFLLANIDFQEGKLICLLDDNSLAKAGISPEKYGYFLEYLRNQNQEIRNYLDSGMIVVYNGKSYTENEKLQQCIVANEETESRATQYTHSAVIQYEEMSTGLSSSSKRYCGFTGPAKISVSTIGKGKFTIKDVSKGLNAVLIATQGNGGAGFKWGVGNSIEWGWDITYTAAALETGIIYFQGYFEAEAPDPTPEDPNYWKWYNNMPNYIQVAMIMRQYLEISISEPGYYVIRVYKKNAPGYYVLYSEGKLSTAGTVCLPCPPEGTCWVVVYRETKVEGIPVLEYIGDQELRDPNLAGYPLE